MKQIRLFFVWNVLTRVTGFFIDAVLITFYAAANLKEFYQLNALFVLVFGLSSYSIVVISIWSRSRSENQQSHIGKPDLIVSLATTIAVSLLASCFYIFNSSYFLHSAALISLLLPISTILSLLTLHSYEKQMSFYLSGFLGNLTLLCSMLFFIYNGVENVFWLFVLVLVGRSIHLIYNFGLVKAAIYKIANAVSVYRGDLWKISWWYWASITVLLSQRSFSVLVDRSIVGEQYALVFSPASRWAVSIFGIAVIPVHWYFTRNKKHVMPMLVLVILVSTLLYATTFALPDSASPQMYLVVLVYYGVFLFGFCILDVIVMMNSSKDSRSASAVGVGLLAYWTLLIGYKASLTNVSIFSLLQINSTATICALLITLLILKVRRVSNEI